VKELNKDNKIRNWNRISLLILALLVAVQGLLLYQVWSLHMLPTQYFLLLCAACLVITGLLGLLLRQRKLGEWQKKASWGKQIIGIMLSIVILAGCLVGSGAVGRVLGTIGAITAPQKVNVVLEVYVRSDDPAECIEDTDSYSYAMSDDIPQEVSAKMCSELEAHFGHPVQIRTYPGSVAAVDALLTGEADALILDTAYLMVFEDMEGYGDVESRIRVLHEYVVEKEVVQNNWLPLPQKPEKVDVTEKPFLVYISGNDARRELLADGGSDVNILVVVNPEDHQILLLNTPRDYYVVNPASGDGSRDKLSHCGLHGIDNCVGAMEELYGIPIDYYARINFSGFRTLIDAIGGVTVYSDKAFTAGDVNIRYGENHLNGDQALKFARERKNLRGGDNDRGKNQMKLISAMIDQLSVGNLISNYSEILKSLEGMFATSMSAEDIGKLVQFQLTEAPSWDVKSFAVTGDNGNDTCWAKGGGKGYVMYPHDYMVEQAKDLLTRALAGEVLTDEDLLVNQ